MLKKPKVLESTVKKEVKKRLNAIGCYHFWPVQMGLGDVCLDCIGCYEGKFFGIEAKAPGEVPTLRQRITMDKMRAAGALVLVIDGAEYGYGQLDYIQRPAGGLGPIYEFDQKSVVRRRRKDAAA
jgi:hypothetical protein